MNLGPSGHCFLQAYGIQSLFTVWGSLDDDTISIQALIGSAAIQLNKYCTPLGKTSKDDADLGFGNTDVKTRGCGLEYLQFIGGVLKSPGPRL